MKLYSGIVKCGTCGVALSRAVNVPEDRLLDAAISASDRAFCAGHSKNSNLDFEWITQEGQISPPAPASVPVEERTFRGGMINMPEDAPPTPPTPQQGEIPAPPQVTPDGIAIADLAEAAGVDPAAVIVTEDAVYIGKPDENGIPQPMRVVGKNPPRADQLG